MNGDAERRDRSRTPSPLSRSSSRSSIGQSPGRTTLLKRNQSLSAKQIRFYRNGDRYFAGLKLAVSSERYKEFFALLVELSNKLDLPTGAVRFVFETESGRQITDVSQLNSNSSYVCSSTNSFKEIEGGYGQTQGKNWSVGSTKDRNELKNWGKTSPKMDSRRDFIKPKLVTVVKNGKPPQKKVTMLLNKKTAVDLDQVLDHLSSKGTLGKVDRLCCLDGREIKGLRDLFNEDMIFIAFSSNERFPEEGFDVDVQSSKQSWKSTIRPTRSPYISSLRTELDLPWKQLPRARCLACALKALTTASTPPPQSLQRPRPKSAGPRLTSTMQKSKKSEPRPSSASARYLEAKPSKYPRTSLSTKEKQKNDVKSSKAKSPRVRSSFPKTSTPKTASAKKSLSFSLDSKAEETTDSGPKPKGIRGGGRRRRAQLASQNGEELNPNDPRHAYYILNHDDMTSGKPTASVKPIMSAESLNEQTDSMSACNGISGASSETKSSEIVVNGVSGDKPEGDVQVSEEKPEGDVQVSEEDQVIKTNTRVVKIRQDPQDEKPALDEQSESSSPPKANEEKPSERDWSKPKPIRGRRKKPNSDVNGNEQKKTEVKVDTTVKQNGVVDGGGELQPMKLVIASGDGL